MYHIPTRRRGCLVFIVISVPILILTCYLTYRQPLSSYYPLGPIHLNLGSRLGILRSTASSNDPQVVHSQDGHLYLNDNVYRNQPVIHPIISLINNATRAWNLKLESQSKDFTAAVSEYQRRNNRNPPKGLQTTSQRTGHQQTKWSFMIFVVSIRNGQLSLSGQQANIGPRPNEMIELLKDIAHLLPDMDIPISGEDLPAVSVSARNYEHHIQAVRNSTFLSPHDLEDIKDHHGLYVQLNGFLSSTQPKVHQFFPLFGFTKLNGFAELPLSPPSQFNQEMGTDLSWEEKLNKLFWRGSTTGTFFSAINNWRMSQRTRLVKFSNEPRGNVTVRKTDSQDNLEYFEGDTRELNEKYFDIGFTNTPVQCDINDGSCQAIQNGYVFKPFAEPSTMNRFKYLLDVDGNGWSGRFHRLMSTKSAVLKSTIFPEWYADRVQPWHHYIPVKVDYQDLYDIMAFFLGDPNGLNGHDNLGKQIGQQGQEWTQEYWRMTDMQAYMYLLLLEYSRLLNRDPEDLYSMDYL
ncbi:hypothetical protein H4Q26_002804 [Puccinia striiformis f. sp. tritici PST-130]|nr:hypothetical protein H4Q26_002804 [Puccinia striiformis f. sp. tritici PST-130]